MSSRDKLSEWKSDMFQKFFERRVKIWHFCCWTFLAVNNAESSRSWFIKRRKKTTHCAHSQTRLLPSQQLNLCWGFRVTCWVKAAPVSLFGDAI